MNYNRDRVMHHVNNSLQNGKTPFISVSQNEFQAAVRDITDAFPAYFVLGPNNTFSDLENSINCTGIIVCKNDFVTPVLGNLTFGMYFSLVTGNPLNGLASHQSENIQRILQCPRIIISDKTLAEQLFEWKRWGDFYGFPFTPNEANLFKSHCKIMLDSVRMKMFKLHGEDYLEIIEWITND